MLLRGQTSTLPIPGHTWYFCVILSPALVPYFFTVTIKRLQTQACGTLDKPRMPVMGDAAVWTMRSLLI